MVMINVKLNNMAHTAFFKLVPDALWLWKKVLEKTMIHSAQTDSPHLPKNIQYSNNM
jgi:hypothetical protein